MAGPGVMGRIGFVFYMQHEHVTEQHAETVVGPSLGCYHQRWNHDRNN